MSAAVAEALVRIGGVGFSPHAPLRFKSGLLSPVYCDNRRFPFHPAEWRIVLGAWQQHIATEAIAFDVIAGVEAAGIPHSAALAYALGKPSVFLRKQAKDHGTKKLVEGGDVRGLRVLLVEDLISTGMSSLAGIRALREEGAEVSDCLAILSYALPEATDAFAAAGVRVHTLTTFAEVLASAAAIGILSKEDESLLHEWLRDPHAWSTAHEAAK